MTVEIIAHRGASFDAPENTLASVQLAWKQNADAVEIDVQFCGDQRVVVIHDDNTRKTGGLAKKVAAQTFEELRKLDVGGWKQAQWSGERIPSLSEVFATIPKGRRLFVEIKCGPESIPAFASDVAVSGLASTQIVPIGFDLETMKQVKATLPALEVCWVVEFKRTLRGWEPSAQRLVEQAKAANLDGVDLSAKGPLDAAFVKALHKAGLKVYIWTVDSPERARQLIEAGVDGITTNRPLWLREQLSLGPD